MGKKIEIRLFKKWTILLLIITISSLLIVGGYIFYKHEEETIHKIKYEEIKAIATLKIDQILNWRRERLSEAEFFANNYAIKNILIENGNYKKNQKIFEENLISIKQNHGYGNIALVNDKLEVIHSLGNLIIKDDPQTKADIEKAIKSKKVFITDFKLAVDDSSIHLDFISPIFNMDSTVIGVIIFCVDPEKFFYPLIQTWPTSSRTSETLLIREEKDDVLFLNELRHKKNTALELRIPKSAIEIPAIKAVSGYKGVFEGTDYRSKDVLSYVTHLEGTTWYMVAKVDKSEIYSELYFRTGIITAFVIILIITTSTGVFWIYHYRQRNLYRSLWEAEEEYKTTLYSIGDAVITTDRKGNVKYLNKVAEELTGWKENEARGKDLELVFNIINEETLERADNPVKKVLREELVIGLANHTVLISKDGREFPIADSGAPIKNEKGEIIGVVLVFRDQTEERRSRNEILKLNRIYGLLSNTNQAIVRIKDKNELLSEICRIAVEDGKFPLAMIGNLKHDGFEITTLVKIDSGNKITNLVVADDNSIIHCVKKNNFENKTYVIINDLEKEVSKCSELIKSRGYKSAGFFAINVEKKIAAIFCLFSNVKDFFAREEIILLEEMAADISFSLDFMKSEEKRIESEKLNELLNFTIEKSVNEIYLFDAETLKFKYANQGAINNLKYTLRELRELTPLDIKPKYTREEFIRMITPLLKNEKIVENFRTFHRRADYTEYPVEVNLQLMERENEKVFLAVIQDITEKLKTEIELEESRERFRMVVDNSLDAVLLTTPDGRILSVNKSGELIFGRTEEEICRLGRNGILDTEDPRLEEALEIRRRTGRFYGELTGLRSDGKKFPVEVSTVIFLDREGNERTSMVIRDVSEREIAERVLRESEAKYRTLIEISPDAIFINHNYNVIYINPSGLKLFGAERPEQLLGKSPLELFHPDFHDTIKNRISRMVNESISVPTIEEKIIRLDGNEIDVEVTATPFLLGNENAIQVILRDITERKRAAEAIKESEDKYRRLAENAQDLIYRYEFIPKRRFTYVSPSATKLTGYTPEDHYSDPDLGYKIIHPDDKHLIAKMTNEAEIIKEPVVLRWLKKDGTVIWTEQRNIPIYNDNKELIAIEGIARDITAWMMAQEELKRNEEKFRGLFENHAAVKLLIDPDTGNIIDANRAASEYYGWSIDELKKMHMSQINTLPKEELIREMIRVRNQEKTHFEMKHRRADGSIRDVDVYSSKVIIGDKDFLHSIIHDITDKKLAEIQLQLLNRSIEQSPVSIIITDLDGCIEYINPKFSEVTGYSFEEVKGQNPKILQSGCHTKDFYKEMWETLLARRNFVCEIRNKKKNGELFWESAVISPIVNHEGKISHFIAIKEDITEKKKIVEELVHAKEEAEKSDKLKSEFLAQMSHEIRTPIHIVTSSIALLRDDMKNKIDEEDLELFESIDISAKRIIRTIDLVLNVSELQLGIYKPNFSIIDLEKSILSRIVTEHFQLAKRKNIELSYSYRSEQKNVNADEYCVTQIFANLIDNAIKYTQIGKVEIIVRDYKEDELAVEVRDTGIGMSKEFLEHIFEPFKQEYHGYSRAYEGNGLGLALVKKYCELNNAEIEVESEKGMGSTFRVIFKRN